MHVGPELPYLEVGTSSKHLVVRVGLVFLAQNVAHAHLDTTTTVATVPVLLSYKTCNETLGRGMAPRVSASWAPLATTSCRR